MPNIQVTQDHLKSYLQYDLPRESAITPEIISQFIMSYRRSDILAGYSEINFDELNGILHSEELDPPRKLKHLIEFCNVALQKVEDLRYPMTEDGLRQFLRDSKSVDALERSDAILIFIAAHRQRNNMSCRYRDPDPQELMDIICKVYNAQAPMQELLQMCQDACTPMIKPRRVSIVDHFAVMRAPSYAAVVGAEERDSTIEPLI